MTKKTMKLLFWGLTAIAGTICIIHFLITYVFTDKTVNVI